MIIPMRAGCDFDAWDAWQGSKLDELTTCDGCGEKIDGDEYISEEGASLCYECWKREEKAVYNIGETPEGTKCTKCGSDPGGEDCFSPEKGIILCPDCWDEYVDKYIRR